MGNSCEQDEEGDDHPDLIEQPLGREDPNGNEISENATIVEDLEFRICRRIAEDALLVCWSIPEKYSIEKLDGYEVRMLYTPCSIMRRKERDCARLLYSSFSL